MGRISLHIGPADFRMGIDIVNLFRFSGLRVQQFQIPLQAINSGDQNIPINLCQLCRKLLGDKSGVVLVQEVAAVALVDGVDNFGQFCRNFINRASLVLSAS